MRYWLALFLTCTASIRAQDTQKFSLGTPSGARFVTPEITWPAGHGDAAACLWERDKTGAVTITIDDNNAGDHPWWLAMGDSLDFRFTWFCITGKVGGFYDPGRIGMYGTWSQFRTLVARGHAVQSHSVAHGDTGCFKYWYGIADYSKDWYDYYYGAVKMIQDSIPGNECLCLAAPGSGSNDLDSAAAYYIANRGAVAYPQNPNVINFKNICSSSGLDTGHVLSIINKTSTVWNKNHYRGLASFHIHSVGSNAASIRAFLGFIKAREDLIWVAKFPDMVRYNMEYATLTMNTLEVTDTLLRYTLTDSMADSIYNYPLTVKVRLNNDWDTCVATQDGSPVEAELVDHDGDTYALVKMVPDAGEVVLTTGNRTTAVRHVPVADYGLRIGKQQRLFRLTGEEVKAGQEPGAGVYMVYDRKGFRKKVVVR